MALDNPKSIFVTFGAGRSGWIGAAKRITAEAERTRLFEFSFNLGVNWLKTWDPAIYEIGLGLRKNLPPRGFGYWTWKPSVLLWAHLNFPSHQIVYMDAGSEFSSIENRFVILQGYLNESFSTGGLAWQLPDHQEISWTKRDLLLAFNAPTINLYSDQIQSGFIALSPTQSRLHILNDWRMWALKEKGFYFTDQSKVRAHAKFQEHRHDQSILSLLWKKFELPAAADMTNHPHFEELGLRSSRNNSSLSTSANVFLRFIFKYISLAKDYILGRDDKRL